jgi:hypothetical protein
MNSANQSAQIFDRILTSVESMKLTRTYLKTLEVHIFIGKIYVCYA